MGDIQNCANNKATEHMGHTMGTMEENDRATLQQESVISKN